MSMPERAHDVFVWVWPWSVCYFLRWVRPLPKTAAGPRCLPRGGLATRLHGNPHEAAAANLWLHVRPPNMLTPPDWALGRAGRVWLMWLVTANHNPNPSAAALRPRSERPHTRWKENIGIDPCRCYGCHLQSTSSSFVAANAIPAYHSFPSNILRGLFHHVYTLN